MKYFVGIDGGGTKTEYMLVDQNGYIRNSAKGKGTSYKQSSIKEISNSIMEGLTKVTSNIAAEDIAGICFGMPCYGESEKNDLRAAEQIRTDLARYKVTFANDVTVACAGTLACEEGLNIVSGTGAMAVFRYKDGRTFRCGGWSEHFSDEGSCYWLGIKTLETFSRQADGRADKGPLYKLIKEYFSIEDDYSIIDIIDNEYIGDRKKIASLQLLLKEAALNGDKSAIKLYHIAAKELARMVNALTRRIKNRQGPINVSYSGGLFKAGDLILIPLKEELDLDNKIVLKDPLLTPVEGAVLLAVDTFDKDRLCFVRDGLIRGKSAVNCEV